MAKKRTLKRTTGKTKKKAVQKARKSVQKGKTKKPARRLRSAARVAAGTCLDLITAGEIVQEAIPGGPHDIDSTLEDGGLITPDQRTAFRDDVVKKVSARGCTIDGDDVPNSAETTLRDARTAVQRNAR